MKIAEVFYVRANVYRKLPRIPDDFRFGKDVNDVTLRQHDICCFENNFSSENKIQPTGRQLSIKISVDSQPTASNL